MTPPTEYELDRLDDARYEASLEAEEYLGESAHPLDCDCDRCVEDRELF